MSAKRKSKFNPYPDDETATKQLEGVGAYMAPDLVAWFAGMPEAELVANASHWQAPIRFYGCGRQKVICLNSALQFAREGERREGVDA